MEAFVNDVKRVFRTVTGICHKKDLIQKSIFAFNIDQI